MVTAKRCAQLNGISSTALGSQTEALPEVGPTGAAKRIAATQDAREAFVPQVENWRQHAGVFSPIRRADFFPAEFFAPGDLALLNMRDPRDCMVSGYFGFLRLHGNGLQDADKKAQYEMGIDAYVLTHMLGRYSKALNDYMALRKQIPDMTVLHYEEMVTSFDSWFEKFYDALHFARHNGGGKYMISQHAQHLIGISPYQRLLRRYRKDFIPPKAENIDRHHRQQTPGDYARKLQPDTIAKINARLSEPLRYFGYA